MTDEEFQRRMDEIVARNLELAKECGFMVTAVFGNEGGAPEFSYTSGLSQDGYPELITFGLPPVVAHKIFTSLAKKMKAGEIQLEDNQIVVPLENHDMSFFIRDVSSIENIRTEYNVMTARMYKNEDYKVFQVFWPDSKGFHYFEQNFDKRFAYQNVFNLGIGQVGTTLN